jgi:signal peptidase I
MMAVLIGLCIAVLIAVAVIRERVLVIRVIGPSMAPALRSGDRLLVRRGPGRVPHAGDIVVLPEPGPCRPGKKTAHASLIVKRVVAAPGDPLPAFLPRWERTEAGVVPPGHLVLLGDNLPMSRDSRHFGQVRADRVVGVVVRRLGG